MVVISLHIAVLMVILLALMQAGCAATGSARPTPTAHAPDDRCTVERVYDSPTGPDLYRVKRPHGTKLVHGPYYKSPLRKNVASHGKRP